MRREPMAIKVGSWRCPSGNSVEVFVQFEAAGVGHVFFEWDSPPPLRSEDLSFYVAVIIPEVIRRVGTSLGLPG